MRPDREQVLSGRRHDRLSVAEYGPLDGIPVLAFHGNPGSRLAWAPIGDRSYPVGVRIIAPDRPGFGGSPGPALRSIAHWPGEVAAMADALGIGRFRVVGVSGGGPMALACATALPDRVIEAGVLSSGPPVRDTLAGLDPGVRRFFLVARVAPLLLGWSRRRLAREARENPAGVVEGLRRSAEGADRAALDRAEVRDAYATDLREAFRQGGQASARELTLFARPWPIVYQDVGVRVRIWHGEDDRVLPSVMGRYLAAHLPVADLTLVPKAGHLWYLDHMDVVLRAFLGGDGASE